MLLVLRLQLASLHPPSFSLSCNLSAFSLVICLHSLLDDLNKSVSLEITSVSHKQKLTNDARNQLYNITLGGGAFQHCPVSP